MYACCFASVCVPPPSGPPVVSPKGVHGQVSDAVAEQSLVSQAVLVLPDSGAVVVPLKHDSLLVGLLVLERTGPPQQGPGPSQEWVPTDQGQSGRSVDVSMDEADAADAAATPWGAGGVLTSESQWDAVCDVAASLSSACTLEQRATLELAYHMAGRSSLQGLVAEVSQPLRTLRTLGALLAPRVGDEAGNRDMVEGIMAQGDRLQQVVRCCCCCTTYTAVVDHAKRSTNPLPCLLSHRQASCRLPCIRGSCKSQGQRRHWMAL